MHPKQGQVLATMHKVGRANVCRKHALFNEFVRIVAHPRNDLFDTARRVDNDLGFNGVKVDRPSRDASLCEDTIKFVQMI